MKKRPLKRSLEYRSRVVTYARKLAQRYRVEIADAFLARVAEAEKMLSDNNMAGTEAPYLLASQQVVFRELYFDAGPVRYGLIHEVTNDHVGLISLWHGVGVRKTSTMARLWKK
jgi:hypothetical protein